MPELVRITVLKERDAAAGPKSCALCESRLFLGEVYYDICGKSVCRDCLGLFARRYFRDCRRQVEEWV